MIVDELVSQNDIDETNFLEIRNKLPLHRYDNEDESDEVDIKWAKEHDWSLLKQIYPEQISRYNAVPRKFIKMSIKIFCNTWC